MERRDVGTVEPDTPRLRRADAHQHLRQLRLAVAADTRESIDLAAADSERKAANGIHAIVPARREVGDFKPHGATLPGFGVVDRRITHHHAGEVGSARAARIDRGDGPAAAHDRDPIRVGQHLAQLVRNQDDAGAAAGERLDRAQQTCRLLIGQHRGRLVEDQRGARLP